MEKEEEEEEEEEEGELVSDKMKEEKIEEEEETQWMKVKNGWKKRGSGRIYTIWDIRCHNCRYYRDIEGCTRCKNNRCQKCKNLNLLGECSECFNLCLKVNEKSEENWRKIKSEDKKLLMY